MDEGMGKEELEEEQARQISLHEWAYFSCMCVRYIGYVSVLSLSKIFSHHYIDILRNRDPCACGSIFDVLSVIVSFTPLLFLLRSLLS
jgi:hypothetical protein